MSEYILSEDLAVWFGKKKKKKGSSQPKGPWVNICKKKKGGGHPPCGRKDSDKGAYPVCRGAGVAGKMTQAEKDSACRRKREKEKKDPQTGKGQKPTRIKVKNYKKKKNESIDRLVNLVLGNETKMVVSEQLQYHLDNKISISENVYRYGSPKYFEVINEARELYNKGFGEWSEEDIEILESERGKFFIYEGERLPLDFPMELTGEEIDDTYFIIQSLKTGSPKYIANIEGEKPLWVPDSRIRQAYKFATLDDAKNYISKFNPKKTASWYIYKRPYDLNPKDVGLGRDFRRINEAEYQGKKVELNKPKTGGSKKWYVYVRNPKTGKIKKVSYGSPVMTAKWNDPAARKSFAARHQCAKKKDKTKAGYWACRAHKDFGKNVSGRFW